MNALARHCPEDLRRLRTACHWLRHASPAADSLAAEPFGLVAQRDANGLPFLIGTLDCGGTVRVQADPTDVTLIATRGPRAAFPGHQEIVRQTLPGHLRRDPRAQP